MDTGLYASFESIVGLSRTKNKNYISYRHFFTTTVKLQINKYLHLGNTINKLQ